MKKPPEGGFKHLAEEAGFEPAVGYKPTHAFQACDLNHSSISPWRAQLYTPPWYDGLSLFSLRHAANNVAKATVNVGDFTGDAAS